MAGLGIDLDAVGEELQTDGGLCMGAFDDLLTLAT